MEIFWTASAIRSLAISRKPASNSSSAVGSGRADRLPRCLPGGFEIHGDAELAGVDRPSSRLTSVTGWASGAVTGRAGMSASTLGPTNNSSPLKPQIEPPPARQFRYSTPAPALEPGRRDAQTGSRNRHQNGNVRAGSAHVEADDTIEAGQSSGHRRAGPRLVR